MTTALQLGLFSPRLSLADVRPTGRLPFSDPFLDAIRARLDAADEAPLTFDERDWDHQATDDVGLDVEVFRNFVVICFKRLSDGKRLAFEKSPRVELNVKGVRYVLAKNRIVTFNGAAYDLPIVELACRGADLRQLKEASDRIVHGTHRAWEVPGELGITLPKLDHVDLIEANPSIRQGLKMLEARLHAPYLVDLPFAPDAVLTPRQMNVATLYCHNDLDATQLLREAMAGALALREALSSEYRTDFRSRSDAQIGEAIVRSRVEAKLGRRLPRSSGAAATTFGYEPPPFLKFENPKLVAVLNELRTTVFAVNAAGKILTPDFLKDLEVPLGAMRYSMGIGGLHSTEAHRALRSDAARQLLDVDVASQYPRIILTLGRYPAALGSAFLEVYAALVDERLAAKNRAIELEKLPATPEIKRELTACKVKAEGLKIAINGVYGKLGSPFSVLYAPHLLIAVTLTGQLSILMLIERAERAGIAVVSANTDGVLFHVPRDRQPELDRLLAEWEAATGFTTERNPYDAICNASVNSYLALKPGGKAKRKGPFSDPWSEGDPREQMKKNPQMTVLSEALVSFVRDGTPLEKTIRACADPRKFITVIKVTGGATWRGHRLGRVVRYYWSVDGEPIRYVSSGNRVQKTEGARPLPELTAERPPDVDLARYVEEAAKLAAEFGIDPTRSFTE